MTTMEMGFSVESEMPATREEADAREAAAMAKAREYVVELDRRARERPYPRKLFRTTSLPVYRAGEPPRLQVDFVRLGGSELINDLVVRAWKRDLHEKCAEEAAKMKARREANGR